MGGRDAHVWCVGWPLLPLRGRCLQLMDLPTKDDLLRQLRADADKVRSAQRAPLLPAETAAAAAVALQSPSPAALAVVPPAVPAVEQVARQLPWTAKYQPKSVEQVWLVRQGACP